MACCWAPPFWPSPAGNNDGKVRDSNGQVVADCGGHEARAAAIAEALNRRYFEACATAASTSVDAQGNVSWREDAPDAGVKQQHDLGGEA